MLIWMVAMLFGIKKYVRMWDYSGMTTVVIVLGLSISLVTMIRLLKYDKYTRFRIYTYLPRRIFKRK